MVQDDGPVGLDGVAVRFDDEHAVANAGIVLVAALAARLGLEALVDVSLLWARGLVRRTRAAR